MSKKCFNYHTIALISHTIKLMLKIFQDRLQQHMNWELPDAQARFRKGRGITDQIANIHWIMEKARELQKNIYFCFIDCAKAFDCVDHNCGKFLKRWEYETTLPVSWETCMWVMKWQLELNLEQVTGSKLGVWEGCILLPYLFNLYAVYILQNIGLDESQAGIKFFGRNINNLCYADNTTLKAEIEEKPKNLLMRVKEESEKVGLKLTIKKN